jgi:hypothetical protein
MYLCIYMYLLVCMCESKADAELWPWRDCMCMYVLLCYVWICGAYATNEYACAYVRTACAHEHTCVHTSRLNISTYIHAFIHHMYIYVHIYTYTHMCVVLCVNSRPRISRLKMCAYIHAIPTWYVRTLYTYIHICVNATAGTSVLKMWTYIHAIPMWIYTYTCMILCVNATAGTSGLRITCSVLDVFIFRIRHKHN